MTAKNRPEPRYPMQEIMRRIVPGTRWKIKPPTQERIRPPTAMGTVQATIWKGVAPMKSVILG